ncbi:hypothetical protein BCJMU51_3192 [Bacillus cereus]|nr:hypothetical protein BCJMU01_3164 [Bacillus cereus]BCC65645.1 hypothetical protein BCJMU39_3168 [Bacillus cereus]BCC71502.1 hypothetical protein BCJMU51_3192 [Bacillus cereus]BCC89236.1 hypothetical protein BC30040_3171 [Bacillus cereus]BCC94759.1 hypothetical protein BC30043_3188 [Bacillus cereus]
MVTQLPLFVLTKGTGNPSGRTSGARYSQERRISDEEYQILRKKHLLERYKGK